MRNMPTKLRYNCFYLASQFLNSWQEESEQKTAVHEQRCHQLNR